MIGTRDIERRAGRSVALDEVVRWHLQLPVYSFGDGDLGRPARGKSEHQRLRDATRVAATQ